MSNPLPIPPPDDNPDLALAERCLRLTNRSLFLTGRAGTGKTTFLRRLRDTLPKRMIVTAPTGVAAINAGGVTLHSFFQIPLGPWLPGIQRDESPENARRFRVSRDKIALFRGMDLLVIDEISMVRCDLLDAVDDVLRRYRRPDLPFGGVQLLMIGDLRQLPPVANDAEWDLLRSRYDTPYFFSSRALAELDWQCVELRRVYRQAEGPFLDLLNAVRDGAPSPAVLASLNRRCLPASAPPPPDGVVTLCTHNWQADRINADRLDALPGDPVRFRAAVSGDFPETSFPMESDLLLKPGAQVMFLKNDPNGAFYNGKIGTVLTVAPDLVRVASPGSPDPVEARPMAWENRKYALDPDSGSIRETVEGTFTQIPLRPAWAVTIHKSQGLTFDRVVVDTGRAFAPGQVYVALSRCRTLDGLSLLTPVTAAACFADPLVSDFTARLADAAPTPDTLERDRLRYQRALLADLFAFAPLQKTLSSLSYALFEADSTLPPPLRTAADAAHDLLDETSRVAASFLPTLRAYLDETPDAEQNAPLAARLRAAADWFLPRLATDIPSALSSVDWDVDNRQLRTRLRRRLDAFLDLLRAKAACFEALAGSAPFTVERLLTARAYGHLHHPSPTPTSSTRTRKTAPSALPGDASPPPAALVDALRLWRKQKAESLHRPAYHIFSQKTLYALASLAPDTLSALSTVYGLGPARLRDYGEEILAVIRSATAPN